MPLRGAVYAGYYTDNVAEDLDEAQRLGFDVVRLFFPSQADDGTNAAPGSMTQEDVNDAESSYFHGPRFDLSLRTLDTTIAAASDRGIKVIISPGLVPGSHATGPLRWRLYRQQRWHREFAEFWERLAGRYRDNPSVVGYLLLNEPGYEVTCDLDFDNAASVAAYYNSIHGTTADLNLLYRCAVDAVRAVDQFTPIIVQPGQFASPHALAYLEPIDDPRVIYCVHWYGPWLYTTWRHNRNRWTYPGALPRRTAGDPDAPGALIPWDIQTLRREFATPVRTWQQQHGISSNRIYIGEFGVDRRVGGAERWMTDMLTILADNNWHWTYYMFREREWSAMDQELGPDPESTTRSRTPIMEAVSNAARGD